jgi:hypothetical protein
MLKTEEIGVAVLGALRVYDRANEGQVRREWCDAKSAELVLLAFGHACLSHLGA